MTTSRTTMRAGLHRIGALAIALFIAMSTAGAAQAKALDGGRCTALREGLERQLGLEAPSFEMSRERTPLPPFGVRSVCQLSLRVSAVRFEQPGRVGFTQALETTRAALAAENWVESPASRAFAAKGPMMERFGVMKGANVCVVEVMMGEGAVIGAPPRAEPVTEERLSRLPPSRRIYTIRLGCISPGRG